MFPRSVLSLLALLLLFSTPLKAETLRVDGEEFESIQEALDAAEAGDLVWVARGTYDESFTLVDEVVVEGEETRETVLTGGVEAADGGILRRFTIEQTGLVLDGLEDVTLTNLIFARIEATALAVADCTDVVVDSNTFYGNDLALDWDASSGTLQGNLLVANTNALVLTTADGAEPTVCGNHFHDNGVEDVTGDDAGEGDPEFVAADEDDFHLRGPAFLDTVELDGLDTQPGAYGGADADPTPAAVTGVSVTAADDPETRGGTVEWSANAAHNVVAYNVYYGDTSGATDGTGAVPGDSPLPVVGDLEVDVSALPLRDPLDGLDELVVNVKVVPADGRVYLSWDAVDGADGYLVSWGEASGVYTREESASEGVKHLVEGLDNGTVYYFSVRTFLRNRYFFSVTSVTDAGEESRGSDEVVLELARTSGPDSAEVSATPVNIRPGHPDLPERGLCLVAAVGAEASRCATWPGCWQTIVAMGVLATVLATLGVVGRPRSAPVILALGLVLGLCSERAVAGWALSLGGGAVYPTLEDYADHYDWAVMPAARVSVGYRPNVRWEFGVEGGYQRSQGRASIDGVAGSDVDLDQSLAVIPVQAYALYQWRDDVAQKLVPYLGFGAGRVYYRQAVEDEDTVRGFFNGYHLRGGIRLSLNPLDPNAAMRSRRNLGLRNTAWYLEGRYARFDDLHADDVDLGGLGVFSGIVFEF